MPGAMGCLANTVSLLRMRKCGFFLTHLLFCNVGYSCPGQSCRRQNVFPAVPSESSPWFEGTATAPCRETRGHPAQGHHGTSVCPAHSHLPKARCGHRDPGESAFLGADGVLGTGGCQWCRGGTAVIEESLFLVLNCPPPVPTWAGLKPSQP